MTEPWIANYLVGIGEELGADIASTKWCEQSRKGQVIRFLTDPARSSHVWGMLSDGEFSLPVKLVTQAAEEDRQLNETPLSDYCILTLQKYRPIFCRAPAGSNSGLEQHPRLVIECEAFTRSALRPSGIQGQPKPLKNHPDLDAWSEGLKQHGGAGNVLKERRQTNAACVPEAAPPPPPVTVESKEPKLICRSKARLPSELLLSFIDKLTYNDKAPADRPTRPATPKRVSSTPIREPPATMSSPEVPLTEWSPTPARRRSYPSPPAARPLSAPRIRPSQVLLSETDLDPEEQEPTPPEPTAGTLEEDKVVHDPQRPVSLKQPYPAERRKVPELPTPKALPKTSGRGTVLAPNSDVSMAGSSQPSQEPKTVRNPPSRRESKPPLEQHQRVRKRPSAQLSQETHYDGDEESTEKQALARAGKKNRTEVRRSENVQTGKSGKISEEKDATPARRRSKNATVRGIYYNVILDCRRLREESEAEPDSDSD